MQTNLVHAHMFPGNFILLFKLTRKKIGRLWMLCPRHLQHQLGIPISMDLGERPLYKESY
jgi:hypothetical protein